MILSGNFFVKQNLIYFHFKANRILLYTNNELAEYIAKFEIIVKRRKSLEMMKDGFDIANCLRVIIYTVY